MLDVKGDKSLWEKLNLEGVGKVLLVEESYYDGIIKLVEEQQEEIERLKNGVDRAIYDLANENIYDVEVVDQIRMELVRLYEGKTADEHPLDLD